MASLNQVQLIGNVGADPEIRYLSEGMANKVAQFSLATKEGYRDKSGEWHDQTEWHKIVAFGGFADTSEKFIRKGSQLFIEGRLRTRSYTDRLGNPKSVTEIVVNNIQLLGGRPSNPVLEGARQLSEHQAATSIPSPAEQEPIAPRPTPPAPEGDDDLPF